MGFLGRFSNKKKKLNNNQNLYISDEQKSLLYLQEALQKNNVLSNIHNNQLILPHYQMIITSWLGSKQQHPKVLIIQINFLIHQPQIDEEIKESLLGIGEGSNLELALKNGIHSFITGLLAPLLQSFNDTNSEPDFNTQFGYNRLLWHAKLGELQIQGYTRSNIIDQHKFIKLILKEIYEILGNKQFYWIKIYASRQANKVIAECKINNEPFPAAQARIEEYLETTDANTQFKSEKQYLIIKQSNLTWSPDKYSPNQLRSIIHATIDLMYNCSTQDEYELLLDNINYLSQDPHLSFELYCFIPEIYCQLVIPEVQYSNQVIIVLPNQTRYQLYLSQFKVYSSLKKVIQERIQTNKSPDESRKILYFSSNFDAINQALNNGREPRNLVMKTSILPAPAGYDPFR